jgi:hypothetical protein
MGGKFCVLRIYLMAYCFEYGRTLLLEINHTQNVLDQKNWRETYNIVSHDQNQKIEREKIGWLGN